MVHFIQSYHGILPLSRGAENRRFFPGITKVASSQRTLSAFTIGILRPRMFGSNGPWECRELGVLGPSLLVPRGKRLRLTDSLRKLNAGDFQAQESIITRSCASMAKSGRLYSIGP
jgi:hypothetical protein